MFFLAHSVCCCEAHQRLLDCLLHFGFGQIWTYHAVFSDKEDTQGELLWSVHLAVAHVQCEESDVL